LRLLSVDLVSEARERPVVSGLKIKGEDMSPTGAASTRIDPIDLSAFVDNGDHDFDRRPNSTWAKKADPCEGSHWLAEDPGSRFTCNTD
jgi:hypothetical protein